MKRQSFLIYLLSVLLGFLLLFFVIGSTRAEEVRLDDEGANATITVGLVVSEAGIDGDTYNWLSYQGLLRAETELGVTGTVYTPTDSTDYEARFQQCANDGNELCITPVFMMSEAILNAANNNPGHKFANIDTEFETYPDNLRGVQFARAESGYLAGVLAGLMSESDVVGNIGGMMIPAVDEFVVSYRNGAQCANPSVTVLVDYAGDFGNPTLGAEMAQAMIAQGADVIFAPAGGTGTGAVLTATQSGAWGIGVDIDFYYSVFGGGTVPGADKLLSSAVNRVDNAVFETISETVQGAFTSGTVFYGLEAEGVGLAPFHEADAVVPQSVKDALAATRLGIINGSIDPAEDCREHVFLPAMSRPN